MRSSLVLIAALACGCGSARTVAPGATPDALRDRRVTVVLADGSQRVASGLRVEADSVSWFDASTGRLRSVPAAEVAEVQRRDAGRSARRGAWRGALVGAAVGLLNLDTLGPFAESPAFGVGLIAAQGAGVGAAVGALWNPPDRYVLARPDSLR